MKYTHVIWDFNGTILDDVAISLASINVLLAARSLPTLPSADAYREVQEFPIVNYYKKIGFDFSKESFDTVAVEWVEQYLSRFPTARVYDGAMETVDACRARGTAQILLSASELNMLNSQVDQLGIRSHFDEVRGMDNIYAHGKVSLAEQWRSENPEARALFVGDTDHDLAVAEAIGADCVLFCRGHQSRARLSALGCPVIDRLSDVLLYL